jgi:hypothetical protein
MLVIYIAYPAHTYISACYWHAQKEKKKEARTTRNVVRALQQEISLGGLGFRF